MFRVPTLIVAILINCSYFSQKYAISVQKGLAFSTQNSIAGFQQNELYGSEQSYATIRGSLGAGNHTLFSVLFRPKENFQLGLCYDYFSSFSLSKQIIDIPDKYVLAKIKAKQHFFQPFLQIGLPYSKINFLLKAGLIFPLSSKSYGDFTDNTFDNNSATQTEIQITEENSYHFSVGFTSGLGFEINLFKNLKLQSFINSTLFSQTLKKKETTAYQINGQENIQNLTTYQKETIYREDLNNFSNNEEVNPNYNHEIAKDQLTNSESFNSIGINLGLVFYFKSKRSN